MKTIIISLILWLIGVDIYAQNFSQQEITDSIFARIEGKSFKENCTTPREDLRYLKVLHYNKEGEELEGELICHKDIADDLLAIFRELHRAKYPIERMVLIDEFDADDEASMRANNTSAFNFRRISGTKALSRHSRGMAIDINPLYNPCIRRRKGKQVVSPDNAAGYTDRNTVAVLYHIIVLDAAAHQPHSGADGVAHSARQDTTVEFHGNASFLLHRSVTTCLF